jgi:membrane fusion protein, hemolysin D
MYNLQATLESADEARRVSEEGTPTASPKKPAAPRRFDLRRRLRTTARAVKPKPPVVAEFHPDAVEIEERPPPRVARLTLYSVLALMLAAVIWASFSRVDTIVTAQGKLITTTASLVVQPLETSVIREIRVKVGDVVSRGQVLAALDPTFSQADLDSLQSRVSGFDATVARLTAELDGKDYGPTDQKNPDEILQRRLFLQRKALYDAQVRNYEAQIASARAVLRTNEDEETLLKQRLETLQSIEGMRSTLMDKELGSRLNFLLSRDARLDVESNLARVRGNRVDYASRLDKARADEQVYIEDFRRTAEQDLVDTATKRNSALEDLKKAELRRQLIVLRAPADGVVLEIGSRTIGSVVREAETMFTLVPRDVPLQAEVNVDGKDVGQIAVGQPVRIKFDAFPFQKYGTAKGVVRVVSQDSFALDPKADPGKRTGPAYYRVLVDVTDMHLRGNGDQFQMIPGMTVTAEMKTGDRRVISYFLYPLIRGLDEGIREP